MKRYSLLILCVMLILSTIITGCSETSKQIVDQSKVLRILTCSDIQMLEEVISEGITNGSGMDVQFVYADSMIIRNALKDKEFDYDAVWVESSSLLTDLNDKVKDTTSIMRSPLVVSVKKKLADNMNIASGEFSLNEILKNSNISNSNYATISPISSWIGNCIYKNAPIYSTNYRTTTSAMELYKLTYNKAMNNTPLDLMLNYEWAAACLSAEMDSNSKEQYQVIYPSITSVADYALAENINISSEKNEIFQKLKTYLTNKDTQAKICKNGFRVDTEVTMNDDYLLNKSKYGINLSMGTKVDNTSINELNTISTNYKNGIKPKFTIVCLDMSGSIGLDEREKLIKKYLMYAISPESESFKTQPNSKDIIQIMPFDNKVWETYTYPNLNISQITEKVNKLVPGNKSYQYEVLIRALEKLREEVPEGYQTEILMITDGPNEGYIKFDDFKKVYEENASNVPIDIIGIAAADFTEFIKVSDLTGGEIVNANLDVKYAFIQMRTK